MEAVIRHGWGCLLQLLLSAQRCYGMATQVQIPSILFSYAW